MRFCESFKATIIFTTVRIAVSGIQEILCRCIFPKCILCFSISIYYLAAKLAILPEL